MESEFEKVVQNPLWGTFKNGLGEDSLKTSKLSVGTSRLQEWVVGSLVHFDWFNGLDWSKEKVRYKIALVPDSRNPYLYGALFPDELLSVFFGMLQVCFPTAG